VRVRDDKVLQVQATLSALGDYTFPEGGKVSFQSAITRFSFESQLFVGRF